MTAFTPSSSVPLAAQSRLEPVPYSLPGQDDQRHALLLVLHGRIVDAHLLTIRQVQGQPAFDPGHQPVLQADVGKGAARHHPVVAAPRAIGVEIAHGHAVLDQVLAGRAVGWDRAGRGDVVGGDRIAQHRQDARPVDFLDIRRLAG